MSFLRQFTSKNPEGLKKLSINEGFKDNLYNGILV